MLLRSDLAPPAARFPKMPTALAVPAGLLGLHPAHPDALPAAHATPHVAPAKPPAARPGAPAAHPAQLPRPAARRALAAVFLAQYHHAPAAIVASAAVIPVRVAPAVQCELAPPALPAVARLPRG